MKETLKKFFFFNLQTPKWLCVCIQYKQLFINSNTEITYEVAQMSLIS